MPSENENMVIKTVTDSSFENGGRLNPDQAEEYVKIIRANRDMLGMVRMEPMDNPRQDIDKLLVGQSISQQAPENTFSAEYQSPAFGKVSLDAKKLRSDWAITTEAMQRSIARDRLKEEIMTSYTARTGADMEIVAIQGDTTLTTDKLRRTLNGWDKQTDDAHIFDADGNTISKDIFAQMLRRLPDEYQSDPDLKWIMSRKMWADWMDVVSNRQTAAGDDALKGTPLRPYGYDIMPVANIPSNKAVTVSNSTPAMVTGTVQDPFEFTSSNNVVKIDVDNAGAQTITLPTGLARATLVAATINETLPGIASTDTEGRLILMSTTKGTSSEIDIQAVANDAYTILGLTTAVTTGRAAGGTNTVKDGSFIWLANPNNFIFGMVIYNGANQDGTRIYEEFNQKFDRTELTAFNQIDCQIEDINAIVKCKNIRLRQLL